METAPARRPGELSFDARRRLFLVGAVGLAALLLWGLELNGSIASDGFR